MNRRDWLKRTSLALAGGLVLGNEVMEQYERLTHKKVFALGAVPKKVSVHGRYGESVEVRWIEVWHNNRIMARFPEPQVSTDDYIFVGAPYDL